MTTLMKWIHMVICGAATAIVIGLANSPLITKNEFIGALFVYLYIILLLIALFKKDYNL